MILELEKRILGKWSLLFPTQPPPDTLQFYIYEKALHKGVGWIFNQNKPIAFIKYMESADVDYIICEEYQNLRSLHHLGADLITKTLPKPFLLEAINGRHYLLTSFHPGEEMEFNLALEEKRQQRFRQRFISILSWLIAFQKKTWEGSLSLNIQDANNGYGRILAEFRTSGPMTATEETFLLRLQNDMSELTNFSLPLVVRHGDFAPANVLWDGDNLFIIDWAEMRHRQLPLFDLFSFISGFKRIDHSNGSWQEFIMPTFSFAYFQENWFSRFVNEVCIDYFRKLELNPKFIIYFLALFLMEKSLIDLDQHSRKRLRSHQWREQFSFVANNYQKFQIPLL